MDKNDKKILRELIKDARKPLSKISKEIKLSRENTYYRINKLIEKKIIKQYITLINYKLLGFQRFSTFIELKMIDEEKESQIINFLKNQKRVSWIGIISGRWSLTFDIFAKNNSELNKFINKFFREYGEYIRDYLLLNIQEEEFFFNKLIDKNQIKFPKINKTKIKMDKIDFEILKKLNEESKISYIKLSQELNLSANTIKNRIKKLEKSQIITKHTISINHKAFGLEWHGIQIKLLKQSEKIETKIKEYFRKEEKIIFYYQYNKTGIYDFDIGVVLKNSSEFREFIKKIRKQFYDEIKILDMFLVLEEETSHHLPEIIFSQ